MKDMHGWGDTGRISDEDYKVRRRRQRALLVICVMLLAALVGGIFR